MKVNIQANYGIYKNRVPDSGNPAPGQGPAAASGRTDRNSITRGHTTMTDRQMLLLKSSVQDYVSAPADRVRLDSLRESVQNGTYHISTADLAGAILADE